MSGVGMADRLLYLIDYIGYILLRPVLIDSRGGRQIWLTLGVNAARLG